MEKLLGRQKNQGGRLTEPDQAVRRPHPDADEGELSARLGNSIAGFAEKLGKLTYNLVRRHWLGIVNFHLLIFLVGAMEAPLTLHLNQRWVSRLVYGFYGFFCHQEPSRSFFVFGNQVAICSRCMSFYLSLLIFGLIVSLREFRPLKLKWAVILILPACADVFLQTLNITESTNLLRTTTGLLLGMAVCLYLFPRAQRMVSRLKDESVCTEKKTA
jgi:uncharacterized membrane protein